MTRRDGGFALLIVLWSLVLITLLVTQVTAAGRTEMMLAANLRNAAVLRAATDGAVHAAVFQLLDPASSWQADDTTRELHLSGVTVAVRITDEAGKLNPNITSARLLAGLLRAEGASAAEAAALADEIVQWRFPSAAPPGTGPLADRYRAAGRDYVPPHAAFQTVDELGLVLGMDPALLARIAPHLTFYTDHDADPRRADPVLQRVLAEAGVRIPTGPPPPARVATVLASAVAANGAHFVRVAIVALGLDRARRPFRFVTWDAPPAS